MNKHNLQTELMVLCDYASVSREGKLSINGIFDELRSTKPPIIMNGFLVATVSGTPNSTYSVSLKAETGAKKQNVLPPMEMNFTTGPNGRHNMLIQIQAHLPHPGDYKFRLYHEGKTIGERNVKVINVAEDERKVMPN
jgi:hypothetical protein